jgi:hypothetical protein
MAAPEAVGPETTTAQDDETRKQAADELARENQQLELNPLWPRGVDSKVPAELVEEGGAEYKMDERHAPRQAQRNADAG